MAQKCRISSSSFKKKLKVMNLQGKKRNFWEILMNEILIKCALIISGAAIIVAIIVMYPTYACMAQLNEGNSKNGAGFMCITGK